MSRPQPSIHQACRSLLQKAVRRGDVDLVRRLAEHLETEGEGEWLRARAHVIAFEEFWPAFGAEDAAANPARLLVQVSAATKFKDAAGLASFAYALWQGDASVPVEVKEEHTVRVVASALDRPRELWAWARKEARTPADRAVVRAAREGYRYAGWRWDKATALAAAYLAARSGVPPPSHDEAGALPCPVWVALDRHTEVGRAALRRVARRAGVSYARVALLSFYLEGVRTNRLAPSPWWEREVAWRLGCLQLGRAAAEAEWAGLRALLEEETRDEAERLANHLAAPSERLPGPRPR